LLGLVLPWLVKSEQLHYWIALVMLVGPLALRPAFTAPARTWWDVALGIQAWHHLEHLLLFGQVLLTTHLLGKPVPTSLLQLAFPASSCIWSTTTIVTIPMVIAVYLHVRRREPQAGKAAMNLLPAALAAASRRLYSDG
jgi:hypothetical protein